MQNGSYEPFSVIVTKEGGGLTGQESAKQYCQTCIRLWKQGETKWIQKNTFTNRVEYLYCKKQLTSGFKHDWTRRTERFETQQAGGTHHGAGGGGATPKAEAQGAGRRQTSQQALRDKNEKEVVSKATRLKTRFLMLTSQSQNLQNSIASAPEWAWAKSDVDLKPLQKKHEQVKKLAMDGFFAELVNSELRDVKKNYEPEKFVSHCRDVPGLVEGPIGELEQLLKRMHSIHKARKLG